MWVYIAEAVLVVVLLHHLIRREGRRAEAARRDSTVAHAKRIHDAGLIVVTCGFLILLGWMVTDPGPMHTLFLASGWLVVLVGWGLQLKADSVESGPDKGARR
jgi:hypothetical protein